MEIDRLRRASRAALPAIALYAHTLLPEPAVGAETIKPTLDIKDMRLVINYISTGELVKLQGRHGAKIDRRDVRQAHREGFSILRTDPRTGARTCEIYLPNDQRPRTRDDGATLTLGHELLHCMLGDYHR